VPESTSPPSRAVAWGVLTAPWPDRSVWSAPPVLPVGPRPVEQCPTSGSRSDSEVPDACTVIVVRTEARIEHGTRMHGGPPPTEMNITVVLLLCAFTSVTSPTVSPTPQVRSHPASKPTVRRATVDWKAGQCDGDPRRWHRPRRRLRGDRSARRSTFHPIWRDCHVDDARHLSTGATRARPAAEWVAISALPNSK
jgi:hypothetical protein